MRTIAPSVKRGAVSDRPVVDARPVPAVQILDQEATASSRTIRAWWRETRASSRLMSLDRERPIVTTGASSGYSTLPSPLSRIVARLAGPWPGGVSRGWQAGRTGQVGAAPPYGSGWVAVVRVRVG